MARAAGAAGRRRPDRGRRDDPEYPQFNQVDGLLNGDVDLITGFRANEPLRSRRRGLAVELLTVDDFAPLPGPGVVVGDDLLAADPPLAAAFARRCRRQERSPRIRRSASRRRSPRPCRRWRNGAGGAHGARGDLAVDRIVPSGPVVRRLRDDASAWASSTARCRSRRCTTWPEGCQRSAGWRRTPARGAYRTVRCARRRLRSLGGVDRLLQQHHGGDRADPAGHRGDGADHRADAA